ncbi:methyltransferase [Sneathiella marina]|uniref:Methyltransferase n=1 Tax=Sneathiella marina TaxID=2950108 RepID=A0ABY4W6H9_9PROT|nr:methyltransferase [Sneathiella marina]USG62775.1 methyltransferase [Sneathiella marina]
MTGLQITIDGFLGNKLKIKQPHNGFRAGSDAVLLASAVETTGAISVLDVGCGVGTAGLCLLHRLPEATLWGLEVQPDLAELGRENAALNDLSARTHILRADMADRTVFRKIQGPDNKPFLEAGFDHVITNPPFYEKGRAQSAQSTTKTLAHIESNVDLAAWLQFCVARVRSKGKVTVIHRTDRLAEILSVLSGQCGSLRVIPLWPDAESSAKRVIVQALKGGKGPLELKNGLILHDGDGLPTHPAELILRHGASLNHATSRKYL